MESESYTKYSQSISKLKEECLKAGVNEAEFEKLYFDSLTSLDKERPMLQRILEYIKTYKCVLLMMILMLYVLYNYQYIYSGIVCSLQDYIYCGLRLLRKIFIPVISIFPSLSEYYYETCLIHNPFFTVVDMDCWPCSTVNNVREIVDPRPINNQHTPPFTYKTEQQQITIEDLEILYLLNRDLVDWGNLLIKMDNKYGISPAEFFTHHFREGIKDYYVWKFHKTSQARLLRKKILRPKVVPKFGQSIERYLIIDGSQKSYFVPDTDCSFAFILPLSGSKTIKLHPANECRDQCKSLNVKLKESHLLWYNWWYWKPEVQPSNENTTFIAYVGSYC